MLSLFQMLRHVQKLAIDWGICIHTHCKMQYSGFREKKKNSKKKFKKIFQLKKKKNSNKISNKKDFNEYFQFFFLKAALLPDYRGTGHHLQFLRFSSL